MVAFLFQSIFAQKLTVDLVVVNANVRTMDKSNPKAEAFAVPDNKIVAVGSNAARKQLSGVNTKTIDAHGKLVLPGFNDTHVQFLDGGAKLSSVELRDATPSQIKNVKALATIVDGRVVFESK